MAIHKQDLFDNAKSLRIQDRYATNISYQKQSADIQNSLWHI